MAWPQSLLNVQIRMGRCHMKVKSIFVFWMLIIVGGWMMYLSYGGPEVCRGEATREFICDNYNQGIIAGSMCEQFCQSSTITLDTCLSQDAYYQVYEGTLKRPPKRRRNMDEPLYIKQNMMPQVVHYDKPSLGSSMEDFRIMLLAYLKTHLGEAINLDPIQAHILEKADSNHDGKVSLPEARSMWALLREKDFLMMMVLGDTDYVPRLLGYCGNLYIMEGVQSYRLYGMEFPPLLDYLLPSTVNRFFQQRIAPPWTDRAHIVVGLLEFVEEILDGPLGDLYMCHVSELGIGYTSYSDVKILSVEGVLTEEVVETSLGERACQTSEDCSLGPNCRSLCRADTGRCSGKPLQPNLQRVCQMLSGYLMNGSPSEIQPRLAKLLDTCRRLEYSNHNMHMDHSLVLNDLKSLLWSQVSHLKKFSKTSRP